MSALSHVSRWDAHGTPGSQTFFTVSAGRDTISSIEVLEDLSIRTVRSYPDFDKQIQCLAYAPSTYGLAAVGHMDGVAALDMRPAQDCDVALFGSPSGRLNLEPSKQVRPCNAVAFSGTNLLASGFDKVRNEPSLYIWNVEKAAMIQSFIPNEGLLSLQFTTDSSLLLVTGSYKVLRVLDLRAQSPAFQAAAKYTQSITMNPLNPHSFISSSDDGSCAIWDLRKMNEPSLVLSRLLGDSVRKGGAVGKLRWSLDNQFEFGVLHDGGLLRRWQIGSGVQQTQEPDIAQNNTSSAGYRPQSIFVSQVIDYKVSQDRVVSFDYLKSSKHVSLLCLKQSGQLFIENPTESPSALSFDPRNNFLLVNNKNIKIIDPTPSASEAVPGSDAVMSAGDSLGVDIGSVLENDISSLMRQRAALGYSLECEENVKVLDSPDVAKPLLHVWQWLKLAHKATQKDIMKNDDYDFDYGGVASLWEGERSLDGQMRSFGGITSGRNYRESFSSGGFEKAVENLAHKIKRKPYVSPTLARSPTFSRRQMCLLVAGWNFAVDELDRKIDKLCQNYNKTNDIREIEKAAGWAVFHDRVEKAIEVLSSVKNERLNLISTAVAGFLAYKDSALNSPWKDQCRALASELDNPYLRAIFTYISMGVWRDVLDDTSLPLKERLGIALRFLSDHEFSSYISTVTEKAIAEGDLEGIILTGLTPRVVDLLQSYVDKSGDVQTAALIISFGSPRFFSDPRIDPWVRGYGDLLNSWSMFSVRAKFDVGRRILARSKTHMLTIDPIERQVILRCGTCKKVIDPTLSYPKNASIHPHHKASRYVPDQITRCQECKSAYPRCAVCLLPLGSTVFDDQIDDISGQELPGRIKSKSFQQWFTFCMTCNHGMHALHAKEWFIKHSVCAIPDCNCTCNVYDSPPEILTQ